MSKNGYLAIFCFIFSCNVALAQAPAWGGGADQTDLSFGFSFSYVTNYFKIDKKSNWRDPYFELLTAAERDLDELLLRRGWRPYVFDLRGDPVLVEAFKEVFRQHEEGTQ